MSSSSDFFLKITNISVSPTESIDSPYEMMENPIKKYDTDKSVEAKVAVLEIAAGGIVESTWKIDGK